ncbi:exported hypothetical protein [Actinacidiphila cocklensis]|uniref:Uncharacterized protein n=1 Tax=Actinacidiphila cocklensis TaxID=887465 RepID=A0A9W4GQ27_9ACTN|nr:exported hypothetical protein [Actinacidiphila cocklensis]
MWRRRRPRSVPSATSWTARAPARPPPDRPPVYSRRPPPYSRPPPPRSPPPAPRTATMEVRRRDRARLTVPARALQGHHPGLRLLRHLPPPPLDGTRRRHRPRTRDHGAGDRTGTAARAVRHGRARRAAPGRVRRRPGPGRPGPAARLPAPRGRGRRPRHRPPPRGRPALRRAGLRRHHRGVLRRRAGPRRGLLPAVRHPLLLPPAARPR